MEKVKQKGKKIGMTIIALAVIFSCIPKAKAMAIENKTIPIYTIGMSNYITFNGVRIRVSQLAYQELGQYYTAYALYNIGEEIPTENERMQLTSEMKQEELKSILLAGYPYKTYQELGCMDELEAYTATQIALIQEYGKYPIERYDATTEAGKRALEAAIKIRKQAKENRRIEKEEKIMMIPLEDKWHREEGLPDYYVRNFKMIGKYNCQSYHVTKNNADYEVKILDEKNNPTFNFSQGEICKIALPVAEMEKEGEKTLELQLSATMETYPIIEATSTTQSIKYLLTSTPWEDVIQIEKLAFPEPMEKEEINEKEKENIEDNIKNNEKEEEKVENKKKGDDKKEEKEQEKNDSKIEEEENEENNQEKSEKYKEEQIKEENSQKENKNKEEREETIIEEVVKEQEKKIDKKENIKLPVTGF